MVNDSFSIGLLQEKPGLYFPLVPPVLLAEQHLQNGWMSNLNLCRHMQTDMTPKVWDTKGKEKGWVGLVGQALHLYSFFIYRTRKNKAEQNIVN